MSESAGSIELRCSSRRAVLLLHGFGDTPQTFCYLAPALHAAGYNVRAPLLPGHGTTVDDFRGTSVDDWLECGRSEYEKLKREFASTGITGLSMGSALAAMVAAESPDLPALVLLAPYLGMPAYLNTAVMFHRFWGPFAGEFSGSSPYSIRNPVERARNLGYGRTNAKMLGELRSAAYRGRRALPRVKAPTLIALSVLDNRVSRRVAESAYRLLGSAEKQLLFTKEGGHVLTVDYGHEQVSAAVVGWLERHLR